MIDQRDFYNNLNAGYRARSANNFRWAAIYACVATLIDGLYATHGYIDIQDQSINYFIAKGFLLLTAFIFLRQIKPSGAQDIQALILRYLSLVHI